MKKKRKYVYVMTLEMIYGHFLNLENLCVSIMLLEKRDKLPKTSVYQSNIFISGSGTLPGEMQGLC